MPARSSRRGARRAAAVRSMAARLAIFAAVLFSIRSPSMAGSDGSAAPEIQAASAPGRPFVVTFWCGPPLDVFDDRRAEEIAAAGFNVVGPPCEGGLDVERNRRALDVAARHGLGMWVADHRFGKAALATSPAAAVTRAVADYREHPATSGYFIADEPTEGEFDSIASLVAAVRAADPERLAYVNLLPDFIEPADLGSETYADYLEGFAAAVRPQLLSYDYYPFGKEKDRSTFFSNLARVAGVSSRLGLPFLLVVLAMPHGPYRDPTEAELAWQVYHALAYGARGISYFAYWTPPGGGEWDNRHGLIEHGRRTLHYYQVARLNRDLRAIAGELAPFTWRGAVDSLGEVAAPPTGPLEAIDAGAITIGSFEDARGARAALLVNRDYRYGARVRLRGAEDAGRPDVFDSESERWLAGEQSLLLPPGGARLLRWRDGEPGAAQTSAP